VPNAASIFRLEYEFFRNVSAGRRHIPDDRDTWCTFDSQGPFL
jgi:hypothetical protein